MCADYYTPMPKMALICQKHPLAHFSSVEVECACVSWVLFAEAVKEFLAGAFVFYSADEALPVGVFKLLQLVR